MSAGLLPLSVAWAECSVCPSSIRSAEDSYADVATAVDDFLTDCIHQQTSTPLRVSVQSRAPGAHVPRGAQLNLSRSA